MTLNPNLRLYDNTRLACFKTCPRKYFYRHVLDWEVQAPRVPLVFGSAWHAAMEVVWPEMIRGTPKDTILRLAMAAFLENWEAEGMPPPREISYELEKKLSPRTPSVATEMLAAYIDERLPKVRDLELVSVERPFVVPLDPEDDTLFYIGKIDKVVRQRKLARGIRGIEHKTTTAYAKDGKFRDSFTSSFSPNSQVDGYLYALHMIFPGKVSGVWVDGALVHKTETGFLFVPIEKPQSQLNAWLWETRYWIDQIEANKAAIELMSPDDEYMAAFPKQTGSCYDFNSACEYILMCKSWPNPLGHEVPAGFRVNKWDPLMFVDAEDLLPKEKVNG